MLPLYLVIETSGELGNHLTAINDGLDALVRSLQTEPDLAGALGMAVIEFGDGPNCCLDLTEVRLIETAPVCTGGGETSAETVLVDLRTRIDREVGSLLDAGSLVRQPLVLILTTGLASGSTSWWTAVQVLHDPSWSFRPHIFAYGFGSCDPEIIAALPDRPPWAYMPAPDREIATSLGALFDTWSQLLPIMSRRLGGGDTESEISGAEDRPKQAQSATSPRPEGFLWVWDVIDAIDAAEFQAALRESRKTTRAITSR